MTPKRFYSYQYLIKQKINSYVNGDSLGLLHEVHEPDCEIYCEEEQLCYLKICRVLVEHFFRQEFDIANLTSNRMNPEKRIEHLRARRRLRAKFRLDFEPSLHYDDIH